MSKWLIFLIGSLLLIAISRKSIRHPRSHGFYRFFAWETILGLFLLNVRFWFYKPFEWNQIFAWLLLCLSFIPLILGIHALRTQGKPVSRRVGEPYLLVFEKTTTLVTSGIFRYIRHPLYSSLVLLAWGIFFKSITLMAGVLAGIASLFLLLTAKAEEAECVRFFGSDYVEYRKNTKMFVPHVF